MPADLSSEAVQDTLPWLFPALAAATLVCVPAYAWFTRGRNYAIFGGIVLGLSVPGALVVHARVTGWAPEDLRTLLDASFAYCMAAAGLHFAHLVRARMRNRIFSPAGVGAGPVLHRAGFMAGFWLLALLPFRLAFWALGWDGVLDAMRWLDLAPYGLAAVSIGTSTRPVTEIVRVRLGIEGPEKTTRIPVERHRRREPAPLTDRPLRIVQITDPHLGPWQSIASLQRILEKLLAKEPDLVLLTGDFLTMESQGTPGTLASALEPVRRLADRSYAIFGNHDHEAPDEVRHAMELEHGVHTAAHRCRVCTRPEPR